MTTTKMANYCRICLDKGITLVSLLTTVELNGTKLTCAQMYESITKLKVSTHEPTSIPQHICVSCFGELNSCYKFQQKAIKSFNLLFCVSDESDKQFEQDSKVEENAESDVPQHKPFVHTKVIRQISGSSIDWNGEEYTEVDYLDDDKILTESGIITVEDSPPACDEAQALRDDATDLDAHPASVQRQQMNEGELICPICSKVFYSKKSLRQHSRTHQDREARRYKCRFCEKTFNFSHHLQIHERTHTKQKPFVCATCGKAFASKDRLSNHRLLHEANLQYACELCATDFRSKKALRMHSILKHDAPVGRFDPIKCDKCHKELFSKSATSAHMKGPCGSDSYAVAHSKLSEKPTRELKCNDCSRVFKAWGAYYLHMKTHRNKVVESRPKKKLGVAKLWFLN